VHFEVSVCLFACRSFADLKSVVLNSQMRRIDLFCKFLGPFAISMAGEISTAVAIYAVLGLNLASVGVEYFAVANVSLAPQIMPFSFIYN